MALNGQFHVQLARASNGSFAPLGIASPESYQRRVVVDAILHLHATETTVTTNQRLWTAIRTGT